MSGFISASEVAFFSLSPQDYDSLEDNDSKRAKKVKSLRQESEYLLSTILISNNLVNVAMIMVSSLFVHQLFHFDSLLQAFIIESVIITFVLLLFGEIMPKVYASQHSLRMCLTSAGSLSFLKIVLRPFNAILVKSTRVVNKRLEKHQANTMSMDELEQAVELTTQDSDEDKELLKGIATFGSLDASSIMTSRMDMITIDFHTTFKNVIETMLTHEYSRIPVLMHSHDNIRGILYAKDLIPYIDKSDNFKWQTLIRPAYFVPEVMRIDALLQEFQRNRVHMAIVVDEFGGTSGLVTMEDVLEEVVGEITDDTDEETKLYTQLDEHTFHFDAKISINDFIKATDIDSDEFEELIEEIDTLAGLVLELRGEIPNQGEVIKYKNYRFTILEVDGRRIVRIKFHIKEKIHNEEK